MPLNNIWLATIKTPPPSKEYEEGWERIFGKGDKDSGGDEEGGE